MNDFRIKDNHFYQNGEKKFLISGEIHYFRIEKRLWEKHLEAAGKAGLSTISTYVPWAWHEPEENVFDFDGTTHPMRDLTGWLKLCQEYGLTCILKPGPFILAEFRGAGLPDWFLERYLEEIKMRDSNGAIVSSDGVSLFNPTYLEKVACWYDQILPLIRDHQYSAGGPVIMMQVCNEIGVFSWLAHQADYGNQVGNRWISFLASKYPSIEGLNQNWGCRYDHFDDIELPPDGKIPYQSKHDKSRDYDWHLFWRRYYGDYLRLLTSQIRTKGITLPVYHNLPGWIYGNGYEFPVNITMYDDLFRDKSEIVFGVDHIPEFFSYRNLHDDRIINDILRAIQGNKPLFAAEFQSGSREYHVVTNPKEMELFYKASIANGLTGWNYYMFSQGRNQPRKGYSGETFYWFTPLSADGEPSGAYPLVTRMNRILRTAENQIVNATRRAVVGVLFYPPYYTTELERPVGESCNLNFVPSAIRRPAYFDGLLKVLQFLNVDYDMIDLTRTTAVQLAAYTQVWAFSTDEMDAVAQQTLVDYAFSGGRLILFPFLPDRNLNQQPCTIIRDAFDIRPSGKVTIDSPLVDIYELKDIKCANPLIIYDEKSLGEALVIARTLDGLPCGFEKKTGTGSVVHLGTWMGFDTEGHLPVYKKLLNQPDVVLRHASADNPFMIVRERFTEQESALLFIGNYYNENQQARIQYTHPVSKENITIPYSPEQFLWPALYGLIIPVGLPLTNNILLLHATSDVLEVQSNAGEVTLQLNGNRDLQGELLLEGEGTGAIRTCLLDEKPLPIQREEARVIIRYSNKYQSEMKMKIVFQ